MGQGEHWKKHVTTPSSPLCRERMESRWSPRRELPKMYTCAPEERGVCDCVCLSVMMQQTEPQSTLKISRGSKWLPLNRDTESPLYRLVGGSRTKKHHFPCFTCQQGQLESPIWCLQKSPPQSCISRRAVSRAREVINPWDARAGLRSKPLAVRKAGTGYRGYRGEQPGPRRTSGEEVKHSPVERTR